MAKVCMYEHARLYTHICFVVGKCARAFTPQYVCVSAWYMKHWRLWTQIPSPLSVHVCA